MKTRTIELDFAERRVVLVLVNQVLDQQKGFMDDYRQRSIMDILDAEEVAEHFTLLQETTPNANAEERRGPKRSYTFRLGQYRLIRDKFERGITAGLISSEVISAREAFDLQPPTDIDLWGDLEEGDWNDEESDQTESEMEAET